MAEENTQICQKNCIFYDFDREACRSVVPMVPVRPGLTACLAPKTYSARHPEVQKYHEREEELRSNAIEQAYNSSEGQQVKRALDRLAKMPEPTHVEFLATIPAHIFAQRLSK